VGLARAPVTRALRPHSTFLPTPVFPALGPKRQRAGALLQDSRIVNDDEDVKNGSTRASENAQPSSWISVTVVPDAPAMPLGCLLQAAS